MSVLSLLTNFLTDNQELVLLLLKENKRVHLDSINSKLPEDKRLILVTNPGLEFRLIRKQVEDATGLSVNLFKKIIYNDEEPESVLSFVVQLP